MSDVLYFVFYLACSAATGDCSATVSDKGHSVLEECHSGMIEVSSRFETQEFNGLAMASCLSEPEVDQAIDYLNRGQYERLSSFLGGYEE